MTSVYGSIRPGGFAEYAAASADLLVHKPAHLSLGAAAALPISGLAALTGLGSWHREARDADQRADLARFLLDTLEKNTWNRKAPLVWNARGCHSP
ncbi:hypothetical protein [Nonomuraea sp. B19D2]|uniref:hypothetical protein n=1 Tax=Nonomuraea sp. B19D2 TaxID=3159561 RepID=UPI0032DAFB8E